MARRKNPSKTPAREGFPGAQILNLSVTDNTRYEQTRSIQDTSSALADITDKSSSRDSTDGPARAGSVDQSERIDWT